MDSWCKVLIVEDEYITRQGIQNMIDWNEEGFEIVGEAYNGKNAIDMVEKLRPHIVLTDIVMPVMDGIELGKVLRTKFPKIQVVVLSSYDNFGYVRDSFQSGAVDYILKPTLNPENLLKTMKQAASRIPGLTLQGRQNLSLARSIEQLLSGFSKQEAKEQLESAFQNSGFLLVGMDISRIFKQDTAAIENQKKLLTQILDKLLAEYTYVHLIVNESVLLIVINFPLSEKEYIYRALHQAMDQIGEQEPRAFYVSSRIFSDISLLKEV
jgi:two-component system response regulator YesN